MRHSEKAWTWAAVVRQLLGQTGKEATLLAREEGESGDRRSRDEAVGVPVNQRAKTN
ncbi:hypothetical protein [Paenibacillus daejeonensis]|uniref:hypothetical protein n=1 Tax=Paenibacillus daejeonensis TaxID=135193 RepID=UPI000376A4C2|nr:hypothetical protein [Paenibacillus daejeonensis]